jgi:hypothetical protein
MAAAFAALAWLTYRLRPTGWWGALLLHTLWAASMVWTFSHVGWDEIYLRAGYTRQQVDAMLRYSGGFGDGSIWMAALWSVLVVGYLLYVRRYFVGPQERGGASPQART